MTQILISLSDSSKDDANELASVLSALDGSTRAELVVSKRFVGVDGAAVLITALGGSAVVAQLSQVLVAWIKRHEHCKVKIGNTEISGYSVEMVAEILEAMRGK